MAKGILIAAMDFSACPEDEFHDWYDLEHVPERLRILGFPMPSAGSTSRTRRFRLRPTTSTRSRSLHSPPYLAIAGANSSPWTKRTQRFRKSLMRYEGEQLVPGDVAAPAGAAADLLIAMNVAPEAEAEFNEWYNTEHIPALGGVRGVLSARRYRGTGAKQRVCRALSSDRARNCAFERVARSGKHAVDRDACARISATSSGSKARALYRAGR